jgi:DNA-directed RNA polymerase subunit RPC12/RpoP
VQKSLLNIKIFDIDGVKLIVQRGNRLRRKELICPNTGCGKTFEKPVMLTDTLSIPRQTYYACPHCRSKLEIIVENGKFMKIISVKKAEGISTDFTSDKKPEDCRYYFGYLRTLPENAAIPDVCLMCPKIIHCFVHQK